MKGIALLAILIIGLEARAMDICGLYQSEDFRDRVVVSLIDFQTYPGVAKTYTITNGTEPVVSGMVNGQCYCVQGVPSADPDYLGDSMFQRLQVATMLRGPYLGCLPQPYQYH